MKLDLIKKIIEVTEDRSPEAFDYLNDLTEEHLTKLLTVIEGL